MKTDFGTRDGKAILGMTAVLLPQIFIHFEPAGVLGSLLCAIITSTLLASFLHAVVIGLLVPRPARFHPAWFALFALLSLAVRLLRNLG